MGRTALVLGAGVGGIVAARTLRRLLPATDRVVAVERERSFVFTPSLLWHITGEREPGRFTRPLAALAAQGVELVSGEIEHIDPAARAARVNGNTLHGDALVIALGADYAPQTVPGLAQNGLNLYTPQGAGSIRTALASFSGGRIALLTAAAGYKCPAAPYEAAMLIEAHLRRRGLRDRTQITLYAAEPAPMPVAGPAAGAQIRAMLERKGIDYFPQRQVLALTARGRTAFARLDRASHEQVSAIVAALAPAQAGQLAGALAVAERWLAEPAAAPRSGDAISFTLREPKSGDIGWVTHRHGILYAEEYGFDLTFEALVAEIAARFVQRFRPGLERCWIAERDGEIAGSVFVVRKSAQVAQLRLLYAEPWARGSGLGRRLVDECIAFARAAGYRHLVLWTQSNLDAARRIYQAAGFRLVKEEPHHSFGRDLIGEYWALML